MQRRNYESAIDVVPQRAGDGVEPGSQESDYALLNLVTLYLPSCGRQETRNRCASDLREIDLE